MDERYESMYQRGHQAEPRETVPPQDNKAAVPEDRESGPVEVAPVTPAGERMAPDQSASVPVGPGPNPYIRLLIIAGCILIVGAVVAFFAGGQLINMQMMPASVEAQQEAFLLMTYGQSLTTVAPFLLALGLGTLLGVAFMKAHAWRASQPKV
ncbi:MAG TPA: hypothetical protein VFM62_05765 [Arthrobacter sp.]|nr:hypothetical protein [Arthrobacter sp.]